MARTRISTTVDSDLLVDARRTRAGATAADFIDGVLTALLARYRSAAIDAGGGQCGSAQLGSGADAPGVTTIFNAPVSAAFAKASYVATKFSIA